MKNVVGVHIYFCRTCLPKLIFLTFLVRFSKTILKNDGVQIFSTLNDLIFVISLLLKTFGCHSNRKSPRVVKICTPSFFKMVLLKLTENEKKSILTSKPYGNTCGSLLTASLPNFITWNMPKWSSKIDKHNIKH